MKITNALTLLTAVFTLSSCSFFTTSLGKNLTRDNTQLYENQSSSDLINLASTSEILNDPEASAQILDALGKKDNLTELSADEKEVIFNLMIGNTITTESVSETVKAVQNLSEDEEVVNLLDTILDSISPVDTVAVSKLLSDEGTLNEMDPFTAVISSMCVMAQVAKTIDIIGNFSNINDAIVQINEGADKDTVINSILPPETAEQTKNDFGAALNCITYFNNHPEKVNEVSLGNMSVGDIIGAFKR